MTNLHEPAKSGIASRPVIIAILVVVSIFASALFITSPSAFSQKTPLDLSLSPNQLDPKAEVAPNVRELDFRLEARDTFSSIMDVVGVSGVEARAILQESKGIYDLRKLREGSVLSVKTVDEKLDRLEYKYGGLETLIVQRDTSVESGFKATKVEIPSEWKTRYISGTIETSLFEDGIKAGADAQALLTLSDIFAWDVDFTSDIQKGDTFSMLVETLYADGKPYKTGRVLGAEMVNNGKRYSAIYYKGATDDGYYDEKGRSLKRAFLKSPLRYRRVTSHFSKGRYHPILKRYRPHHGVDYGAPTGTPIESAASGKVEFAGWKGGYGKYVLIRHGNGYSTAYGHLSGFAKGVRTGAKIGQGDLVGYVGSTGISTGPHLHYEVRAGNRLVNPLSIKTLPGKSLGKKEMQSFASVRDNVLGSMKTYAATGEKMVVASR